jgi:hypothetical protein
MVFLWAFLERRGDRSQRPRNGPKIAQGWQESEGDDYAVTVI